MRSLPAALSSPMRRPTRWLWERPVWPAIGWDRRPAMLQAFLHMPGVEPADVRAARTSYARRYGSAAGALRPLAACDPDPDRPVRVGFLSSDFRNHPVASQLAPIFEHGDRQRILPVA